MFHVYLCLLTILLALPSSAQNVHALELGEVLFTSSENGNYDIFAMNPDTTDLRQLTDSTGDDVLPSWSPDGTRILFVSNRDGNDDLYLMNTDGSDQQNITNSDAHEVDAAWSPDGTRIVFVQADTDLHPSQGGTTQLFIMNLDGSGLLQLTDAPAFHNAPAWTEGADGEWIAYVADTTGIPQIYKLRTDGSQVTQLTTDTSGSSFNPAWSPDGTRIVFDSMRDDNRDIYVMNADGSGIVRLTSNPADDMQPVWTFDGQRLMYTSNRTRSFEIYRMNADGTRTIRLTNSGSSDQTAPFCLWDVQQRNS